MASLTAPDPQGNYPVIDEQVLIIGAGPFGLSISAHMRALRIGHARLPFLPNALRAGSRLSMATRC